MKVYRDVDFYTLKPEITGKQQSKNFRKTQKQLTENFSFGRVTLVVGRPCCAGCMESTIRYCNNYIEHLLFDVNKALTLSSGPD